MVNITQLGAGTAWGQVQPLGSGICTFIDVLFFFVGLCFNFSKGDGGMTPKGIQGLPLWWRVTSCQSPS